MSGRGGRRRRCCRAPLFGLFALTLVTSCGGGPEPATSPPTSGATSIDWNGLDWWLPRGSLAGYNYWFADFEPDAASQYRRNARSSAPSDSVGAAVFATLAGAEQAARRELAAAQVRQAFLAIADRAYRLRDIAAAGRAAIGPLVDIDRVMLRALRSLHTAVGTDPTSADAWFNLAYFAAVVGDRDVAQRARVQFLAITADAAPTTTTIAGRRCRLILDEAWDLRDDGHYAQCDLWLEGHAAELASGPAGEHALLPGIERALIHALAAAEEGRRADANAWLALLPRVPVRRGQKTRDSEYLRTWVHAWIELRDGQPEQAAYRIGNREPARLQAGIAWRYWQDLGLILEELGDVRAARQAWRLAHRARPYLAFFPMSARQGQPTRLGLPGTTEPYFVAYRSFFNVGSFWGYAATQAQVCQAYDPERRPELWRRAMRDLDTCIRRRINDDLARLVRARLNLQRGEPALAARDLEAVAIQSLAGATSEAEYAFLRGVATLNSGDYASSLPWFERCVGLVPNHARAWQSLAVCLAYLDRDAAALAAFDRVEHLQPSDGVNFYNRGLLHLQHGRLAEAEADLVRAAQLLPDNQGALQLLQAVATGHAVTVDLTPQPLQLVATTESRASAETIDAIMTADGLPPDLVNELDAGSADREVWLDLLEQRYADEPTPFHRQQLAAARALTGDHVGVTALLAPSWPASLSTLECALLLEADRATGELARAEAVAAGELAADLMDLRVLIVTATILLDHGRAEQARVVLAQARALAPDEPAVQDLIGRMH